MSQNKRQKMDPEATSYFTSVSTGELFTTFVDEQVQTDQEAEPSTAVIPAAPTVDECKPSRKIFVPNSESFKDAVTWSGFVDKSLLIKELLLGQDRRVLVFAPKRFGKSLNMDMVKCFLEIEKNRDVKNPPQNLEELKQLENYKVFCRIGNNGETFGEKCKILNETELVKEHFGRHPVLYLNLKDIEPMSIQHVRECLAEKVHKLYVAHSYLRNSNCLANFPEKVTIARKNCEAWCNKESYMKENLKYGLTDLVEYLHAHHGRKVYLLVDEFDAPTIHALLTMKTGYEVEAIENVVIFLLGAVMKGQVADKHLLGELVTGVSYFVNGLAPLFNNIAVYKFLQNKQFVDYYGLTDDELQLLLNNVIPPTERGDVKNRVIKYYNGYCYEGKKIYCLWSVLHYVRNHLDKTPQSIDFWDGSPLLKKLAGSLQNSSLMMDIHNLMRGQQEIFLPVEAVKANELADFMGNKMKLGDKFDPNVIRPNVVLTFLLEQGYLSVHGARSGEYFSTISVVIPNEEVKIAYESMFTEYYTKICGFPDLTLKQCASVFKSMPADASKSNGKLQHFIQDFFNHWTNILEKFQELERFKKLIGVKKRSLQAVLYCSMLMAGFRECIIERHLITDTGEGNIDLWMLREDGFAIIWELKFNETKKDGKAGLTQKTSQYALHEILEVDPPKKVAYVKILDQRKIERFLLIGLSVSGEYELTMCCLGNSRDLNDCISFPCF